MHYKEHKIHTASHTEPIRLRRMLNVPVHRRLLHMYYTTQHNTTQYNTIQYNTIMYNDIHTQYVIIRESRRFASHSGKAVFPINNAGNGGNGRYGA